MRTVLEWMLLVVYFMVLQPIALAVLNITMPITMVLYCVRYETTSPCAFWDYYCVEMSKIFDKGRPY